MESYLMTLTVPQRLLIVVMMRMAHHSAEPFLTQVLLPQDHDLKPQVFSLSAQNIIATDQLFFNTAIGYPTVAPIVKSAIDRALGYAKHHDVIGQALADQPALPHPTPDFEVDLAISMRQRQRLALFCLLNILSALKQTTHTHLGQFVPSIVLLDKLLPKHWYLTRQTMTLDEHDLVTLTPILLAVRENYSGFNGLLTQLLNGVKAHDQELWDKISDLIEAADENPD